MDFQNDRYTIRKILQIINRAWLDNHLEMLNDYFDEKMVIMSQDFKNKTVGRKACILSYKQFIETAKILDYDQSDPQIEFWSNTGVAVYSFSLNYEMNNKKFSEKGEDIFVFNREEDDDNSWKAVWRTITVFEKKQSD
jgi:hypothetical protein